MPQQIHESLGTEVARITLGGGFVDATCNVERFFDLHAFEASPNLNARIFGGHYVVNSTYEEIKRRPVLHMKWSADLFGGEYRFHVYGGQNGAN